MNRLAPLPLLLLAGCVQVAIRTDVAPGGGIRRRITVDAEAPLAATRLAERFGPTWTITRRAGGKSFAAERHGMPEGAPNPTAIAVEVRRGLFATEYRFSEDLRPAPRAIRPGGVPLFRPVLADDTSLELLYKMATDRMEVHLELSLPGRPVEGNWQARGPGGTFLWNGNVRSLPAIHARTRVLHPLPILLAAGGLVLAAGGGAWGIIRSRREP